MNKKKEKIFLTKQFIIALIILTGGIISLFLIKPEILLANNSLLIEIIVYTEIFTIIYMTLYTIGYFRSKKMIKNIENIKSGKLRYEPYTITKEQLLEDCKTGLIYSIIRIDNQIYEIEAQLDQINSTNYDKFICYINDNKILGLDNFLNYKFHNNKSLNEFDTIEFLEYASEDPKKYFVDRIL